MSSEIGVETIPTPNTNKNLNVRSLLSEIHHKDLQFYQQTRSGETVGKELLNYYQ